MDYLNRHVVVTGGTGALGTAVVGALVGAGAQVHVPCINTSEAERFAFRDHNQVKLLTASNLADEAEVARLYDSVPELWASIHLVGGFAMAAVVDTKKADFVLQLETNLVTTFLCCRNAARVIARTRTGGRIVNTGARPGLEWRSGAGMAAYAASKAAVLAFSGALAEELVTSDILVNAVVPSIMDTPGNRAAMPGADHASWPKVEDVAATILFLASPENRVTRGAMVPVYGKS